MKYKKSMIMIMLAIFLISIAAASASDVNDAATASEDTNQMELSQDNEIIEGNLQISEQDTQLQSENDETVSAKNELDILSENEGTYTDLQNEIYSSASIQLTKKYYRYNSTRDAGTITIDIASSVVIDGNGAVIDMAGSTIRVFKINTGATTVTIKNLTIKNANFNGNGAAVYANGNVNVINCNFVNNKANGDGGAVFFENGFNTGNLANCNFTNNTATNGGAVYFKQNTGSVTKCNFINNSASECAGAIAFYNICNIEHCNFVNNAAYSDGGALFTNEGNVANCNFVNNTASRNYGAVSIINGNVTNCNFINNTASGDGGAIRMTYGSVTTCNFYGNNATTGSAIYFSKTILYTKTVSNSCFLNNRANAKSLEITKNDNKLTITFTGNDNLLNAIYSPDDDFTFTNVAYWGADGIANTGPSAIKPLRSNNAAGQKLTVAVIVNGKIVLNEVKVTDNNGMIVLDIKTGENYFIGARHDTDSYYSEAVKTISNMKFNVNVTSQTTTGRTVNLTANSNIPNEIIKGKLLFILPDGNNITANYAGNGTWWAIHTFDDYTSYEVKATYIGLDNVTASNGTITINKQKTEISAKAISATYNTNKNLVVTLTDINGNPLGGLPLTVKITGSKTYTTDKNGQVKISVGKLAPKTYNVKVTFGENENYLASSANVKVTVKKAASKITAKKKTFKKSSKVKKYTVVLKSGKTPIKKAKLTLKIKGKTINAKTNKKGKATFKIKLTKKGKFKATIKYKGNKYFKAITKKVKITIK